MEELEQFEYERPSGFDWQHIERYSGWHRICSTTDGGYFAIQLSPWGKVRNGEWRWPVAFCEGERPSMEDPLVAFSFTELLDQLLGSNGKVLPRERGYRPYCSVGDLTMGPHPKFGVD